MNLTTDEILLDMAKTFKERNAMYKDNYKMVGTVMVAMFPGGVCLETEADFNRWHLFELLVVKLTRFVNSGLVHEDSIHDIAIYAAMIETLLQHQRQSIGPKRRKYETQSTSKESDEASRQDSGNHRSAGIGIDARYDGHQR